MWAMIGVSTFLGIACLLLISFPVQGCFPIMSKRLRAKLAKLTDTRVQLMSEFITGIQVTNFQLTKKEITIIIIKKKEVFHKFFVLFNYDHKINGRINKISYDFFQMIKMYGWEKPFSKFVMKTRIAEMKKIRLSSFIRVLALSMLIYTERITLYFCMVSYALTNKTLSPEYTYIWTTFFNLLQLTMVLHFLQALISWNETTITINRIEVRLIFYL